MTEQEVREHIGGLAGDYKCYNPPISHEESLILYDMINRHEPHWIPVEQESPKIGEYVLCQTTPHFFKTMHCFNNYHVCQFVDKDKWTDKPHFDWDRDGFPHVIAWTRFEPYKGVTE